MIGASATVVLAAAARAPETPFEFWCVLTVAGCALVAVVALVALAISEWRKPPG